MKISIKRITIENFRNYVSKTEFFLENGLNTFVGDNGAGKTTLLSAITWCLFGVNIYSKKVPHFGIYPVIDEEERKDLTPLVEIELGNGYILKRMYVKDKTKCSVGNYDGTGALNFTNYTNSNYEAFIKDKIIDKETWELLSNLEKLPRLHWQDLKKLIFNLLGGIEDEVILANDDYSLIENDIRIHGIDATAKNYKQTKASIKSDIDSNQTLLKHTEEQKDELLKDFDPEEAESRKAYLSSQIENYEETNKKAKEAESTISEYTSKVSRLEFDIDTVTSKIKTDEERLKEQDELYESSGGSDVAKRNAIEAIETEIRNKRYALNTAKSDRDAHMGRISTIQQSIDALTKNNEGLIKEGKDLQAKEIKLDNDTCKYCGQELPEEKQQAVLVQMKVNRKADVDAIVHKINYNKELKETHTKNFDEYKALLEEDDKTILSLEEEIKSLESKREEAETATYDALEETEQQKRIKEKKVLIEQSIEVSKESLQKLKEQLGELQEVKLPEIIYVESPSEAIQEKEDIAIKLDRLSTYNSDIEKCIKKADDLSKQLVTAEDKIQQMVRFKAAKSKMITDRVSSQFRMVEFITSETLKDGDEVETFKIAYNGIEYNELSTAEKIKVGFDLVSGVQRLRGYNIPILIDNLESVTNLEHITTQVIAAKVVPQDLPKVELVATSKIVEVKTNKDNLQEVLEHFLDRAPGAKVYQTGGLVIDYDLDKNEFYMSEPMQKVLTLEEVKRYVIKPTVAKPIEEVYNNNKSNDKEEDPSEEPLEGQTSIFDNMEA